MTASWLRRMGWNAAVLDGGLEGVELERGTPEAKSGSLPAPRP